MDTRDWAAELIARNRVLLAQAEAARRRAQERRLRAEQALQKAKQASWVAEQQMQWVAPQFNLRATALVGRHIPVFLEGRQSSGR